MDVSDKIQSTAFDSERLFLRQTVQNIREFTTSTGGAVVVALSEGFVPSSDLFCSGRCKKESILISFRLSSLQNVMQEHWTQDFRCCGK